MSIRFLLVLMSSALALPALGDAPGTRIGTGSDVLRMLESVQRRAAGPCDGLREDSRRRCLADASRPQVAKPPAPAPKPVAR